MKIFSSHNSNIKYEFSLTVTVWSNEHSDTRWTSYCSLHSNTIYLGLASDSTKKGFIPTRQPPLQIPITSNAIGFLRPFLPDLLE